MLHGESGYTWFFFDARRAFVLAMLVTLLVTSVSGTLYWWYSRYGDDPTPSGNVGLGYGLMGLTLLIMAGTFGFWRAGLISNALFAAGVAAVVLVLLGGTTWLTGGFWAPDGAYSRFVSPIIGLVWVVVVSRILLTRSPATRSGW